MSFIRTRKIDWNKFLASMVACDPYGLSYLRPEAFETPQISASDSTQAAA